MTIKFSSPRKRWILNFTENGRQRRLSFKTKQEAKAHWESRPNLGAFWLSLDDGQRAQIIAAWEHAQFHKASLLECVMNVKHATRRTHLPEAVEQFVEAKKKIGLRERSLTDLTTSLRSFCKAMKRVEVSEIKTSEIEDYLEGRKIGAKRFNVIRGNLINFFNWAKSANFITDNPAISVNRAIEDDAPIRVLQPDEAKELLNCALRVDRRTLPYFTLSLFCGIRPAEVMALRWEDINFDRKIVHVSPNKSKTRKNRYVTIPPNALQWLKLGGELPCHFVRTRFKRFIRPKLTFQWSQDVMRHSFASYHLACNKNESSTCYELGDNSTTLFRHYRKLVTLEQSLEFFRIRPFNN